MKKTILNKLALLFISIVLFSCQKDDAGLELNQNSDTSLAEKYLTFLRTEKAEGTILIQSNSTMFNQDKFENISFSERKSFGKKVEKDNNRHKIILSNSSLNSLLFTTGKNNRSNNNLSSVFGTTLSYGVKSNTNKDDNTFDKSVYIPEILNISVNTSDITVGTVFTWNIDTKNENGVAVIVEYNPVLQPNVRLAFDNPLTVKESAIVPDLNGSYTVTQNDLDRFPKGSQLSISIMRAGFDVSETDEPVLAGITSVKTELQLVE